MPNGLQLEHLKSNLRRRHLNIVLDCVIKDTINAYSKTRIDAAVQKNFINTNQSFLIILFTSTKQFLQLW